MGAGASSTRIQNLQRRLAENPLPQMDMEEIFTNNPELFTIFKLQVKECLHHVRLLNEKIESGVDPDCPEIKEGLDALIKVLSAPIRSSEIREDNRKGETVQSENAGESMENKIDFSEGSHEAHPADVELVERLVGRLHAGDYFGEIALLSRKPRQATVRASGRVTLLQLDREAFWRLCGGLQSVLNEGLARYCAAELGEEDEEDQLSALAAVVAAEEEEAPAAPPAGAARQQRGRRGSVFAKAVVLESGWAPPVHEKSPEEEERLSGYLANTALLCHLDSGTRQTLILAVSKVSYPAEAHIIEQGAEGDFYYILDSGRAEALIHVPGGEDKKVFEYGVGGSFGELALMHGGARLATVRTLEPCECWALDRDTFRKIMMSAGRQSLDERSKFLSKVELLRDLQVYDRFRIAEALQVREAVDGEDVVREGDDGDSFYIVQKGNCMVHRMLPATPAPDH